MRPGAVERWRVLNGSVDGPRRFSDEALKALKRRRYAGNVRELRNAVDRFCLGVVAAEPMPQAGGAGLVRRVDLYERQLIEAALRSCGGNVSAAAELLEIPRKTLYDRINRHGLVPEDFRGA